MTRFGPAAALSACLAAALVAFAPGAAKADGYPPFYGYSGYYGGPATYFTPESDVQQATNLTQDGLSLGTRTYYRGGPYWGYEPAAKSGSVGRRSGYRERAHRRRVAVLRRRG